MYLKKNGLKRTTLDLSLLQLRTPNAGHLTGRPSRRRLGSCPVEVETQFHENPPKGNLSQTATGLLIYLSIYRSIDPSIHPSVRPSVCVSQTLGG